MMWGSRCCFQFLLDPEGERWWLLKVNKKVLRLFKDKDSISRLSQCLSTNMSRILFVRRGDVAGSL